MEHIHRNINQPEEFEVIVQQDSLPVAEITFVVEVTNEADQTYFHVVHCIQMIEI
jgi:hypothetical protein